MKKYISLFLCILLLASCSNSGEKRSRVLKVYNWADYIDEEVLTEFPAWYKEQTGEDIRIIYQVFDINEIMLTKIERGQEDFDLVCPIGIHHRTNVEERSPPPYQPQFWEDSGLYPQHLPVYSERVGEDQPARSPHQ